MIDTVPKQKINDEWEKKKTAIISAARDAKQTQGTSPRKERWDDERKKITQEKKNETRKKWLQLKTGIRCNTYIDKRNEQIKFAHERRKND